MEGDEQILQGLKKLAEQHGPLNTLLVQVLSIDEAAMTCDVIDDDVNIYDVRLRPVLNGNESITIFPKAGTWALIMKIEDDEAWQVISVDEADKVRLTTDTTEIEINEGVLIKRGDDTLKQAMVLLIEAVEKIIVLQGTNPDRIKLAQSKAKVNNILK